MRDVEKEYCLCFSSNTWLLADYSCQYCPRSGWERTLACSQAVTLLVRARCAERGSRRVLGAPAAPRAARELRLALDYAFTDAVHDHRSVLPWELSRICQSLYTCFVVWRKFQAFSGYYLFQFYELSGSNGLWRCLRSLKMPSHNSPTQSTK